MVMFGRNVPVTLIRSAGSEDEQRQEVLAGGDLDTGLLLQPGVDIQRGDEIHADHLDEPRVVSAIHPKLIGGELSYYDVELIPRSEHQERDLSASIAVVNAEAIETQGEHMNLNYQARWQVIGKPLGEGGQGKVFLVRSNEEDESEEERVKLARDAILNLNSPLYPVRSKALDQFRDVVLGITQSETPREPRSIESTS